MRVISSVRSRSQYGKYLKELKCDTSYCFCYYIGIKLQKYLMFDSTLPQPSLFNLYILIPSILQTGCVITHIYPDGAIAADKRLNIFDHIVEVNSKPVNCSEMTTLKVHQIFHTTYEKVVTFQVFRADPFEVEKLNIEFIKKPGKDLGLSLAPNERGCTISEIVSLYEI